MAIANVIANACNLFTVYYSETAMVDRGITVSGHGSQ